MGWVGELSSMVLSRGGQRLISGVEMCNSDSNSEQLHKLLDLVDLSYKPHDLAKIDKIYKPVEPSSLISKQ